MPLDSHGGCCPLARSDHSLLEMMAQQIANGKDARKAGLHPCVDAQTTCLRGRELVPQEVGDRLAALQIDKDTVHWQLFLFAIGAHDAHAADLLLPQDLAQAGAGVYFHTGVLADFCNQCRGGVQVCGWR